MLLKTGKIVSLNNFSDKVKLSTICFNRVKCEIEKHIWEKRYGIWLHVINISLLCFSVFFKYFNSNFIFLSYENKLNNFKCYWIITTGSIPEIQNALIPKYSEIAWGPWPPNSHGDYSFFLLPLASVNWLLPMISILSQDSPIY